MLWFMVVAGVRPDRKVIYIEAGDGKHAVDRARGAGFNVKESFWGPFHKLWEASAKERFCDFTNGIWVDRPPKDKKYRMLYVALDEYLKQPDVVVLGGSMANAV